MLSKPQIVRLIDSGSDQQLIRRVLGNGRGLDASCLVRLLDGLALRTVALALAAHRLDELTYGPEPSLDRCYHTLCLMQDRDGAFPGHNPQQSALATAAALGAMVRRRERAAALGEPCDEELRDAVRRAAMALARMLERQPADDLEPDVVEIMMWLLGSAASNVLAARLVDRLRHTVRSHTDQEHLRHGTPSPAQLALAFAA